MTVTLQETAAERNRALFDGAFGAVYSFYMERPRLSRLIARSVWRSDIRPFYSSLLEVASLRDGLTVVDAPCGAGVALRHLRRAQQLRYVAVDISPAMLERTWRRARRARLDQVEMIQGDATSIPLEDGAADVFLSYFGLHCFDDPRAALAEARRCLGPSGRLVGSAIVPAGTLRGRLLVRPRAGGFGPLATAGEIRRWLGELGFLRPQVDQRGVFAYFSGDTPPPQWPSGASRWRP